MMKQIFALATMLASSEAFAGSVILGNFAPGVGEVVVSVDGSEAAVLAYKETSIVEYPGASFQLEARSLSGEILHSKDVVEFVPRSGSLPAIWLAGDGATQTYRFVLDKGPDVPPLPPHLAIQADSVNYSIMYSLAPFEGAERAEHAVTSTSECTYSIPGRSGRSVSSDVSIFAPLGLDGYGPDGFGGSFHEFPANWSCVTNLSIAGRATIRLAYPFEAHGVYRILAIGNDVDEPFEALAILNGSTIASAQEVMPQPSALIRSEHFWFDTSRPAQGITLHPTAFGTTLLGAWFTFSDTGAPSWYTFEGRRVAGSGRYEVAVHRSRRASGARQTETKGTGELVLKSCNQAEFSADVDGVTRVMHLQRSVPVERCEESD